LRSTTALSRDLRRNTEIGEEKEISHEDVIAALAELGPSTFIDPKGWC
jgi:hypothetical protein